MSSGGPLLNTLAPMFSTLELILYLLLPAYVAMFVMAYVVRRRNREVVPSLLPAKPSAPAAHENFGEWVAINFGPLGCLVFLPLLLVLAVLSYPCAAIPFLVHKKRVARFLDRMKQAGRTIDWEEARHRLHEPRPGTLLREMLSMKGPAQIWWTPDAVAEISPFRFVFSDDNEHLCFEKEFAAFGEWSYSRYTSAETGNAFLVEHPKSDRKVFWQQLKDVRHITTYWRYARRS